MGIDGIDILKPDDDSPAPQVRERKAVSQHTVEQGEMKYVFGWDPPLQSFYLQVHNTTFQDEDNNPVMVLGADKDTVMYHVEDLVKNAQVQGLHIGHVMQYTLANEKDDGV